MLQVPIVGVKPTLRRSKRLVRFGTLYGRVGDMGVKPIFPTYQIGTFNRNVNRPCNPTPFRSESLCFKGICTSQVYDGVVCRRSGNCPHLISRVQSECPAIETVLRLWVEWKLNPHRKGKNLLCYPVTSSTRSPCCRSRICLFLI